LVGDNRVFDADFSTDGITAVGVHNVLFASNNGAVLQAFDQAGNLVGAVTSDTNPQTLDFFGLTTDVPVARITVTVMNPSGFGLDNLYFGQAVPQAIPEPRV